jgi:Site-specific recombinases, DNA invertase Pin homologs
MFDRLGRKEDETPFVVEWFDKNGIEVWSAKEGQQKFDTHVDKLMNYIRYWQASGESLKTSVRVKTRLAQIVQEGRWRGGGVPYGYQLVKNGRLGKKNKELYDLKIEPDEAAVIQRIFDFADHFGYGGRRISSELYSAGIVNQRTGEPFHYSSIQNILRNITYVGILRSGETQSEIFSEIQIILPDQYRRIEKMRNQRTATYLQSCAESGEGDEIVTLDNGDETTVSRPPRNHPRRVSGNALLSGNIYCGHCGGRIFASSARKTHHAGCDERISIYKCYNRTQHKDQCDGPTTYRAQKVDEVVESILRSIFQKAKSVDSQKLLERQTGAATDDAQKQLKKARVELQKSTKELAKWEDLMLDSIEGTCVFTPEQIKKRMDVVQEKVDGLTEKVTDLQREIMDTESLSTELQEQHQQLLSWAEVFSNASIDEKKVIAGYLVKAVTLTRDYGIQIEFNISEAQYLSGMEMQ